VVVDEQIEKLLRAERGVCRQLAIHARPVRPIHPAIEGQPEQQTRRDRERRQPRARRGPLQQPAQAQTALLLPLTLRLREQRTPQPLDEIITHHRLVVDHLARAQPNRLAKRQCLGALRAAVEVRLELEHLP
jgi:hypothetical protein